MNILFLNPQFIGHYSRTSRSPAVTKGGTMYYPIWLAYAVGVAEATGHNVMFLDASADGLDIDQVFNRIGDFIPDLSIVDTSTPSIYSYIHVAERSKTKSHLLFLYWPTLALPQCLKVPCVGAKV